MNMKLLSNLVVLALIGICCVSCQNGGKAPVDVGETPNKAKQISIDDLKSKDGTSPTHITDEAREALEKLKPSPEENKRRLANNRAHANSLIDKRSKTEKAYAMMTAQPLLYRFVFNGKKMSKQGEYDGQWIQFMDDFTYKKGKYDKQTSTGRYHLTLETMKLIMVDSDEGKMPDEFKVLTKDDVVIFQGSDYFGNNPFQMKLEKGPIPKPIVQ